MSVHPAISVSHQRHLKFPRHQKKQRKKDVSSQKKKRPLLSDAPNLTTALVDDQKDETPQSWRRLVEFDDDLEYDYSAVIDCEDWTEYVRKSFSVKDSKVGLFYNAKEEIPEKIIEFKTLEGEVSDKSLVIILQWDKKLSSLSAQLQSNITVFYSSHLITTEKKMTKKITPLFCFQELHKQLIEKGTRGTYDPDRTNLRFTTNTATGKKVINVTLKSNAAGCLYQTFVTY